MKNRGIFKELLLSISGAFVLGYVGMCVFWAVTGFKYGIATCFEAYKYIFAVMLAVLVIRAVLVSVIRNSRLNSLESYADENGYDDTYYLALQKYMNVSDKCNTAQNLRLAAAFTEYGNYSGSREVLKRTDFKSLEADEQNEYFNILLYGALLEKDISLANDIYGKAKLYFDRALMKGKNGNTLHTIGLLCLENCAYNQAESFFFKARLEKDNNLRCECDLCLGRLYLETHRKEFAKRVCYNAADEVCTKKQAEGLKQLMINVEKAYRR